MAHEFLAQANRIYLDRNGTKVFDTNNLGITITDQVAVNAWFDLPMPTSPDTTTYAPTFHATTITEDLTISTLIASGVNAGNVFLTDATIKNNMIAVPFGVVGTPEHHMNVVGTLIVAGDLKPYASDHTREQTSKGLGIADFRVTSGNLYADIKLRVETGVFYTPSTPQFHLNGTINIAYIP